MKNKNSFSFLLLSVSVCAHAYDPALEIHRIMEEAVVKGEVRGAALGIYNEWGQKMLSFPESKDSKKGGIGICHIRNDSSQNNFKYDRSECSFNEETAVPIASSTKWVTSTLFLAISDDLGPKYFSLETSVSQLLSCSSRPSSQEKSMMSQIRLKDLLSFTAGIQHSNNCVGNAKFKLKECACDILRSSVRSFPGVGNEYVYGETYHTVAAAMAESALEKAGRKNLDGSRLTIQNALDIYINKKLGVNWMYGFNAQHPNPNLSGTIVSSLNDYALFVRAMFFLNHHNIGNLMSPQTAQLQNDDAFTRRTKIISSPWVSAKEGVYLPHHYGLNNWRECYVTTLTRKNDSTLAPLGVPKNQRQLGQPGMLETDASCSGDFSYGHSGKHGYTPWIDSHRRYFAILALNEEESQGGKGDGTDYSNAKRALKTSLMPHINALFNRAPIVSSPNGLAKGLSSRSPRLSLDIQDPDRDSIEFVGCKGGCPTGLKVQLAPRSAGSIGQQLSLTWTAPRNSKLSTQVELQLRDLNLASKDLKLNLKLAP